MATAEGCLARPPILESSSLLLLSYYGAESRKIMQRWLVIFNFLKESWELPKEACLFLRWGDGWLVYFTSTCVACSTWGCHAVWGSLAGWFWCCLDKASSSASCVPTLPPLHCPWLLSIETNFFHCKGDLYIEDEAFDREALAFTWLIGPWRRKSIYQLLLPTVLAWKSNNLINQLLSPTFRQTRLTCFLKKMVSLIKDGH